MNEIVKTTFDYTILDAETAAAARSAVGLIRDRQHRIISDVAEIGTTLVEIKGRMEHGQFLPWLDAEFDWTERTAQNFMSVAERFGSNTKCVSDLPLGVVYQLAAPSTPDTVRKEIVNRLDAGDHIPVQDIKFRLAEAKKEQRKAEEDAKKSPEARKREKERKARERREREKWLAKYNAEQNARADAMAQTAALIREKFGDDLPRLVDLLDQAGEWKLANTLRPEDDVEGNAAALDRHFAYDAMSTASDSDPDDDTSETPDASNAYAKATGRLE